MCRLFAITSREPLSPMVAIDALNVMREGHDGSGVGLFLRDLSGPFEDMKDAPILSGIFSEGGLKRLDAFMMDIGFMTKYKISIKVPKTPPPGVPAPRHLSHPRLRIPGGVGGGRRARSSSAG